MKPFQISQTWQLLEQFTEKVRKYARPTLISLVCFISLPLLFSMFKNSNKLRFFHSFDTSIHLPKHFLGKNVHLPLGEQMTNNSSKPLITSTIPVKDDDDDLFFSSRLFSKESCISRYEYSSYLNNNNKLYKPSPYLISKLRSYERLHAQCGPQSLSYKKTITKLSKSPHLNDTEAETMKCKYLVWTPANGLGNRMISMASAFLYSLLQNRVFLVEFGADMDGLFCEPFPNSTWLLPKKFPHRNNWSQLPTFKNRANAGEYNKPLSSFLHVDLHHGDGDYNIQHFHCNGNLSFLDKFPILILQSDQYFVPSLFMIPSFTQDLNKMFPKKDTVFHHLGRYLFNPSNEAWGLITRFYRAYLAKSDEKIGLQIRIFHHQKDLAQDIISQVLSCTQSHNILPSFDDDTHKWMNFNSTSKSKSVIVASLYPEYAEGLKGMYWTRPTSNGNVIGIYQASHEEYQRYGDNMHNLKAWAEIYLLSLCDVIVTSPQSTFGYVAQSLGGLKPWIMVRLGKKSRHDPPCKRGVSMEPCFHISPRYDCKDKTKIISDFTQLYPHLTSCEDLKWGSKLVDA